MHMGGVSGIQRPGGQGLPPHPGSVNGELLAVVCLLRLFNFSTISVHGFVFI